MDDDRTGEDAERASPSADQGKDLKEREEKTEKEPSTADTLSSKESTSIFILFFKM